MQVLQQLQKLASSQTSSLPQIPLFKGKNILQLPLYLQRLYLHKRTLYTLPHQCVAQKEDFIEDGQAQNQGEAEDDSAKRRQYLQQQLQREQRIEEQGVQRSEIPQQMKEREGDQQMQNEPEQSESPQQEEDDGKTKLKQLVQDALKKLEEEESIELIVEEGNQK